MNKLKSIGKTSELAKWYDKKYEEMGGAWNTPPDDCEKHLYRIMLENNDSNSVLLDIGCGGGHFLKEAENFFKTAGIEISEIGLEEADTRAEHSNLFLEDIEKTNFDDSTFDIATSIGSLEHVVNLREALKEISRILASEGLLYVFAPNEKWMHDDQPNEIRMNKEEWLDIAKEFELVSFDDCGDNNAYLFKNLTK
jgi:ubiquinone/menaquinone biosynthesis C-methylase UbiE